MSWERVVDLALHAYPRGVREARGAEMRGIVLQVGDRSRRKLVSESLALVGGGAQARAGEVALLGNRRLIAGSCALAVTAWGLIALVGELQLERTVYEVTGGHGPDTLDMLITSLVAVSVELVLAGFDRLSGLCGLAWIGLALSTVASQRTAFPVGELFRHADWFASVLVPFGCYVVLIISPRGRRRDLWRLVWLLGAVLLGLLLRPGSASVPGMAGITGILILAVAVAGVLSLASDPRHTIAFALVLIASGLSRAVREAGTGLDTHYLLQLLITTLVPMALMAGVAVRLVAARRSLPG